MCNVNELITKRANIFLCDVEHLKVQSHVMSCTYQLLFMNAKQRRNHKPLQVMELKSKWQQKSTK